MTCVVCGDWTNPVDLCHTCEGFFSSRYENDGKVLELILEWFRNNTGGAEDE